MLHSFVDSFRAGPGWSCSKAVYKLPETCRVSCQNKFGKLVRQFSFILKKFVTMHGHMNVKFTGIVNRYSLT